MVSLTEQGTLIKVAENKVTDAIFKVIKTRGPANEFALACSGGLFFARYEKISTRKGKTKFIIAQDFLLANLIVT